MTKSHNKSGGLLSHTFGLAKKIGETGLDLLDQATSKSVTKLSNQPTQGTVIEGSSKKTGNNKKKYDNPQQMMREHVPQVSRQLLGRHYNRVNNVASFISPTLNDKMSDYFFEKLNDFVSNASSVEHVLKEVGARDLQELRQDVARSERISQALANQNKVVALVQGSLTGLSGVIGAAIDVPTSLALALRMVYQTGRAHGFELNKAEEQEVVQYIFKQIDFGSVAEKQALLVAVRTISNVIQTHNVQQLQQFLGSDSNAEPLKKWLSNEDGHLKWAWIDKLPQMSFLSKLTPLAGAGISAVYSWKLVEDANDKAITIFAEARRYLILHPDEQLTALVAYEKSEKLLASASPILLADLSSNEKEVGLQSQAVSEPNQVISDVQVIAKQEDVEAELVTHEKTVADLATEFVQPPSEQASDTQKEITPAVEEEHVVETSKAPTEAVSTEEQNTPEKPKVAQELEVAAQTEDVTKATDTESPANVDNKVDVKSTEKKQPELKRTKKSS